MNSDNTDRINLLRSVIAHRAFIASALGRVGAELERRAAEHDLSKLRDDEFEGFARINAAARINKFGSPEYAEGMRREKPTLDLHFSRNRHHAEFHGGPEPEGADEVAHIRPPSRPPMSFLDVIEMVCDWWAASKGYGDTRAWADGVALNLKVKGHMLTEHQKWLVREVAEFLGDLPCCSAHDSGGAVGEQGSHSCSSSTSCSSPLS